MEQIAISKFKATCLAVIERVRTTGQPVLVTRFGKPVAVVGPVEVKPAAPRLGALAGQFRTKGDIAETPAVPAEEWEVLAT
jgi:prevent-host-death family protein